VRADVGTRYETERHNDAVALLGVLQDFQEVVLGDLLAWAWVNEGCEDG
jgi:hypothetical protein